MEPAAARASMAFKQEARVVIKVFVTDRYYSFWRKKIGTYLLQYHRSMSVCTILHTLGTRFRID